jgi:hypothetical protein
MEQQLRSNVENQEHYHACNMRCISWSALIFGGLIAISLSFLFNLFSLAVGLSAFPATPEGKTEFAAAGFIGLVIISIITMFFSGWVAGSLGRGHCQKRCMGELYGFGAWSLALVATIFLATNAGQFLNQKSYVVDRNFSSFQLANEITKNVNEATDLSQHTTSPGAKNAATTLGITSFATFFILFIGALSATFGGRIGMRHRICARSCKCGRSDCPKCK